MDVGATHRIAHGPQKNNLRNVQQFLPLYSRFGAFSSTRNGYKHEQFRFHRWTCTGGFTVDVNFQALNEKRGYYARRCALLHSVVLLLFVVLVHFLFYCYLGLHYYTLVPEYQCVWSEYAFLQERSGVKNDNK